MTASSQARAPEQHVTEVDQAADLALVVHQHVVVVAVVVDYLRGQIVQQRRGARSETRATKAATWARRTSSSMLSAYPVMRSLPLQAPQQVTMCRGHGRSHAAHGSRRP